MQNIHGFNNPARVHPHASCIRFCVACSRFHKMFRVCCDTASNVQVNTVGSQRIPWWFKIKGHTHAYCVFTSTRKQVSTVFNILPQLSASPGVSRCTCCVFICMPLCCCYRASDIWPHNSYSFYVNKLNSRVRAWSPLRDLCVKLWVVEPSLVRFPLDSSRSDEEHPTTRSDPDPRVLVLWFFLPFNMSSSSSRELNQWLKQAFSFLLVSLQSTAWCSSLGPFPWMDAHQENSSSPSSFTYFDSSWSRGFFSFNWKKSAAVRWEICVNVKLRKKKILPQLLFARLINKTL